MPVVIGTTLSWAQEDIWHAVIAVEAHNGNGTGLCVVLCSMHSIFQGAKRLNCDLRYQGLFRKQIYMKSAHVSCKLCCG